MAQVRSLIAEHFSITRGGPLHRVLVRLGHAGDERQRVIRRALFVILITWLPLLLLSLLQGQAWGHQIKIPYLRDLAVNVRFLITVPILILAESRIDRRWHTLVLEFLRSGLVDEKTLRSFEAVLERTTDWRDRVLPEILLVVAAFFTSIFIKTELLMSGTSNWHTLGSGAVSAAGWWFSLVSTPIFRLLLLRWVWRLFLGPLSSGVSRGSTCISFPHILTWRPVLAFYRRAKRRSAQSSSLEGPSLPPR